MSTEGLYFPAARLKRSKNSKTGSICYSVDASRIFGPSQRLNIYVEPSCLPGNLPSEIQLMVYADLPELNEANQILAECTLFSEHDLTFRFNSVEHCLGSLYLPKALFKGKKPDRCYVQVWW